MVVSQINIRMRVIKQMNVTLFISVLLIIPALINSNLIINEFKLWGEASSHFIEIYNTNDTTDIPFASNYSIFLLVEPDYAKEDFKINHVIDIPSLYDVVNAGGYLAIETPNVSVVIEKNNTYAIVLHELINGSNFEVGDKVDKENFEDTIVFTQNENARISLIGYRLKLLDHQLLDIMENESLNVCVEQKTKKAQVLELKEPSSGQPNLCSPVPVVTTAPTTITTTSTETTSSTVTTDKNTTVNESTSSTNTLPVSTVPVTSPQTTASNTSPKPPIPTTIHNLISPVNLTINEFNIYMGDRSHTKFIEIHGQPNAYFANTTLELINGHDGSSIQSSDITHMDEKGFFVITYASLSSIDYLVMAIKENDDVIDGFIITKDGSVNKDLKELYSPTHDTFILDPSVVNISADLAFSVSKCGRYPGFTDGGFMLTASSMGDQNNCSTYYHKKIQLKLKNADCKDFQDNIELKNEIVEIIIRSTSKTCKCGLSSPVLQERSIYCGSVIFEAYIKTLTKQESENYYKIYQQFVNDTPIITVNNVAYEIDNTCYSDCYVHKQPETKSGGDIDVTIAIVVTCVVIFIVIVVIVVILLKKKRNGTLQFSMVRLEEDNNLLMDDAKGVRFREGSAIII